MIAVAWMVLIGSVLYVISYRKTMRPEDWWQVTAIFSMAFALGPMIT
jgi:hypothetical protein